MDAIHDKFANRFIGFDGFAPSSSCPHTQLDLSLRDFFLWGYLKDMVYVNSPATFGERKQVINPETRARFPIFVCEYLIQNFRRRMRLCTD